MRSTANVSIPLAHVVIAHAKANSSNVNFFIFIFVFRLTMIRWSNRRVKMLDNERMTMKSSELFWRRFDLEFEFFYIPSSPFFLAVFWPFIGRIARYTPSSRPQNASKIKANLEFHKSSDDFYNVYRAEHWRVTNHKRYAHLEQSYGLFLYRRWLLQSFWTQRGKSLSAGEDNGGRVISVHFIHFCFFAVSHSSKLWFATLLTNGILFLTSSMRHPEPPDWIT